MGININVECLDGRECPNNVLLLIPINVPIDGSRRELSNEGHIIRETSFRTDGSTSDLGGSFYLQAFDEATLQISNMVGLWKIIILVHKISITY